ncbi:mitochondrial inner membrane protease ATP23 isoform X1 [Senna tora]|uniref:Mitochondrial inner membrane protease ATP23 n=1 Tax=Senna tora TaxID=362788 RepID=A0A834TCI4_9FABA|nr:mitochondrial inner membrane protease ATP23 isoform X1 [Senna tora]
MVEQQASSSVSQGRITEKEWRSMVLKGLRTPMARFLRERLEEAGCPMGRNFIKVVQCSKALTGGYISGQGIVLCANNISIQDEVNQTLIHELIHAYDDCRAANMDRANCAHTACTEIRAAHLSGDCHYKRELLRGHMKIRGHEQRQFLGKFLMTGKKLEGCISPSSAIYLECEHPSSWIYGFNGLAPLQESRL